MTAVPNIEPAFVTRYRPVLDALLPCCPEAEARPRIGMLYLRDRAARVRTRANWEASLSLAAIESIASVLALRSMPAAELAVLHRSLIGLMSIATMLETRGSQDGGADG
jgi:hypothetical protein